MSTLISKKWAFDIDGVIANTFPLFKLHFEREYKLCLFEMPYYPDKYCSNVNRHGFMSIFDHIVKEHVIPPNLGMLEVAKEYSKKVDELVFITNRVGVDVDTEIWLDKHFKGYKYKLHSGGGSKVGAALEEGCTGIIDDKVKICRMFIENGLDAILHKQGHQIYENHQGLRRLDWEQIRKILQQT